MLEVSSAWRAAILNQMVTRQFRVMARLDLSGSILVSGLASIATPAGDDTSKPEQLADGIIETDYAYASLDSAWVIGDGKRAASTIYGQTGYVGKQLSGSGGAFAVHEQLTFTMASPTMINHITIAFDNQLAEHAVDFDVAFFSAAGAEIGRWAVTGNSADALSLTAGGVYTQVVGVKTYKLIVKKWSAAGRTCKVLECYSGSAELVTGEDRLISMVVDESSEPTGSPEAGAVMSSSLTLALDNADRRYDRENPEAIVYQTDMRKKRIQAYVGLVYGDGSAEVLLVGTFFVDNWGSGDGEIAKTVKASDMLAAMDRVTYKKTASLTYPATVKNLIADAFACAGFGLLLEADVAYDNLTIPAEPNFDGASCREVLRYAAQIMNGSIFQTRDARIRCMANVIADGAPEAGLFGAPVLTIGPDAYYPNPKTEDNAGGPTRVIVKYGAEDALEAVRTDAAEETRNGITELKVTGNPIARAFTATNAHFANLAWSILKYSGHARKWMELSWRGDPALEAGDVVTFVGTDGTTRKCRVSKQTLTMDGSLKASSSMRY